MPYQSIQLYITVSQTMIKPTPLVSSFLYVYLFFQVLHNFWIRNIFFLLVQLFIQLFALVTMGNQSSRPHHGNQSLQNQLYFFFSKVLKFAKEHNFLSLMEINASQNHLSLQAEPNSKPRCMIYLQRHQRPTEITAGLLCLVNLAPTVEDQLLTLLICSVRRV